jgi:hypothetical protein
MKSVNTLNHIFKTYRKVCALKAQRKSVRAIRQTANIPFVGTTISKTSVFPTPTGTIVDEVPAIEGEVVDRFEGAFEARNIPSRSSFPGKSSMSMLRLIKHHTHVFSSSSAALRRLLAAPEEH